MRALARKLWLYFLTYLQRIRHETDRFDTYLRHHPWLRKWVMGLGVIMGPTTFLVFLLLTVVWMETPSREELRNNQNQVASEVYSADSVLLGRYFIQDRTEITYEEISPYVIDALISTEDERFYEHSGLDYWSLGRVLVKGIFMQEESAGGGSTLTQQLSKNLYPRKNYWFFSILINKMREMRNAMRLERMYSKPELLTLYLNTVPFSDNVFGIQQAAQRFFSVTAKELTLDQAALLIGTLKATHTYNPRLFPERALSRRTVVLYQMRKNNRVTNDQVDSVKQLPLELQYSRVSHHEGLAPYFREVLKSELMAWCQRQEKPDGTPYNLYTDGLKIYTTIDSRLQQYAEQAVTRQMEIVQNQFFEHWGKSKPWRGREFILEEAIRRSSRYRQLMREGLSEEEILEELEKPVLTKLFTWKGEIESLISPLDSIIHHLQYLNAGFVVMEPSTGQVKAWVGGIAHDFFQFDHVRTSTKRQVGSTFKPIVFATALEQGVDPCELISAARQTYIDDEGEEWTPRNGQNDYRVQYTMPGALAYSVNTVAVKLIVKAGVENTIRLAKQMGIVSDIPKVPSISLGSSSVSLLEMTTAFACLANDGVTSYPYFVTHVVDLDGNIISDFIPKESGKRVLSQESAMLTRHMMQTVVNEGTAARMRYQYNVHNDMGGKTGTTQSNADGWFLAITPTFAIGSWVGADDPRIRFRLTSLGQGSSTALPIAAYFMQLVNRDKEFETIAQTHFPALPPELQKKLACDLYELDEGLVVHIEHTRFQRDSILQLKELLMQTDSIAADTIVVPQETFLQQLYQRKLRIQSARMRQDSLRQLLNPDLGGG